MSSLQNQPNPINKPEEQKQFPTDYTSQQLAQAKIQAREKLLSMPPEVAQKQVEQTLYPQHWEYRATENPWEESIPTHYGKTDP